jgi:hypothetical protein
VEDIKAVILHLIVLFGYSCHAEIGSIVTIVGIMHLSSKANNNMLSFSGRTP